MYERKQGKLTVLLEAKLGCQRLDLELHEEKCLVIQLCGRDANNSCYNRKA